MTDNSKSYIHNLQLMRGVVKEIQGMTDPDVDALVPLVEKGLSAKKVCSARIEAVEKALGINQEEQ